MTQNFIWDDAMSLEEFRASLQKNSPALQNTQSSPSPLTDPVPPQAPPQIAEQAQPQESPGALDYVLDVPKGLYNGAVEAVKETGQFGWDVANFVGLTDEEKMPGYDALTSFKAETKTIVGDVTEGVTNFGLGVLGAGKFLKAGKLLQGAGKAAMIGRGLLTGAAADFIAVDPLNDRLSNLIQQFDFLENPITNALQAEKDDSRWQGRFKNATEGLLTGVAAEILIGSIKALRGIKHNDPKALSEGLEMVEHHVGKEAPITDAAKITNRADAPDIVIKTEAPADAVKGATKIDVAKGAAKADVSAIPEAPSTKNRVEGTSQNAPIPVGTPEQQSASLWKEIQANSKSPEELRFNAYEVINPARFSFRHEETWRIQETISRKMFDKTFLGKGGSKNFEEITGKGLDGLEDYGFSKAQLTNTLASVKGGTKELEQLSRDTYLLQDMLGALQREYGDLGTRLQKGLTDSIEDAQHFQYLESTIADMHITLRNQSTTVGRALVVLRKQSSDSIFPLDRALGESSHNRFPLEPNTLIERLRKNNFSDFIGNKKSIMEYASSVQSKKISDYFTEPFLNSILSNPITHKVNTISNAIKALTSPISRALGNGLQGNMQGVANSLAMYGYMRQSIMPSLRFAWKALKEDRTILEGASGRSWSEGYVGAIERAWSRENVRGRAIQKRMGRGLTAEQAINGGSEAEEILASVIDSVGKIVNLPGRFLKAEDEFFKQLSYRSNVRASLTKEAWEKYGRENSQAIADYIVKKEQSFFDAGGAAKNKGFLKKAKEQTWTQNLERGSIGHSLQQFSNSSPFVKVLLPFVRTPTNLLLDARDHIPLVANVSKKYRNAIKQGGEAAAEAQGKVALGGLLMAGTMLAAKEGLITGAAPTDPKLRAAMERTGWKPNSIKIGDTYYSFNRADPFSTIMSAAANFVTAVDSLDPDDSNLLDFGKTLLATNMRLIGDKSYFQSIGDMMDAWSGDERAMSRLYQNVARGMIPMSGLAGWLTKTVDDTQRDVNSINNRILASIPGFSSSLPAKRDWLTGQPLASSHGFVSPINEDVVARELAQVGGVYHRLPYILNKAVLTEEQHSRYAELVGTLQLNGKTLHQTLNSMIRSEIYDVRRGQPDIEDEDRARALNTIITAYRKAAGHQLIEEDPALKESVQEAQTPSKKKPTAAAHGLAPLTQLTTPSHENSRRSTRELLDLIERR